MHVFLLSSHLPEEYSCLLLIKSFRAFVVVSCGAKIPWALVMINLFDKVQLCYAVFWILNKLGKCQHFFMIEILLCCTTGDRYSKISYKKEVTVCDRCQWICMKNIPIYLSKQKEMQDRHHQKARKMVKEIHGRGRSFGWCRCLR